MDAIAKATFESVPVEERHEELKVFFFAIASYGLDFEVMD